MTDWHPKHFFQSHAIYPHCFALTVLGTPGLHDPSTGILNFYSQSRHFPPLSARSLPHSSHFALSFLCIFCSSAKISPRFMFSSSSSSSPQLPYLWTSVLGAVSPVWSEIYFFFYEACDLRISIALTAGSHAHTHPLLCQTDSASCFHACALLLPVLYVPDLFMPTALFTGDSTGSMCVRVCVCHCACLLLHFHECLGICVTVISSSWCILLC